MNEFFERELISFAERLNEDVYNSYASGKITLPQIQEIYSTMREWTHCTENLLNVLNKDGFKYY